MARQQQQQPYSSGTRIAGTVIKWMPEKGFGFILGDDGKEYFFHRTAFLNSTSLDQIQGGTGQHGTPVTFTLSQGPKGPRAEDVDLA